MFLRSLTLKGFKSFADTTSLDLEPGVTVVVGPNGSGKSNVVDAIAWVLGAQAPSAVRSQKMDDVIFAGTAKRAALGRAEVTLTIDNSAGLLPIDVHRGDDHAARCSEAGTASTRSTACRAGCSTCRSCCPTRASVASSTSSSSQGQIDAVLNARPEDRRSDHRGGRRRPEVSPPQGEGRAPARSDRGEPVAPAGSAPRGASSAASRSSARPTRLAAMAISSPSSRALRLHLAGQRDHDVAQPTREHGARPALARAAGEHAEGRARRAGHRGARDQSRLAALGGSDVSDSLVRFESMRERARGLMALLAERRRGVERDRGGLLDADLVASLEAEAARVADELAEVDARALACCPRPIGSSQAEAALAEERAAFAADGAVPEVGAPTASAGAGEARGELAARRAARSSAPWVSSPVSKRGSPRSRPAPRSWRPTATCTGGRANRPKSSSVRSSARVQRAEAVQHDAEADLAAAQDDHRAADADRHVWSARAEALALALDQRGSDARWREVDGAVGALTDLVDVDEGWSAAFEAAVGDALTAVIVDGTVSARRVLAAISTGGDIGAVLAPTPERTTSALRLGAAIARPVEPSGRRTASRRAALRRDRRRGWMGARPRPRALAARLDHRDSRRRPLLRWRMATRRRALAGHRRGARRGPQSGGRGSGSRDDRGLEGGGVDARRRSGGPRTRADRA